jgi:hypothetical protein
MFRFAQLTAASALALSGCGTGDGNDSANAANAMPSTDNGQLTVRAQGVDLKINLPPPIRRMAEDNGLLYPRARAVRGPGDGQRFHSSDAPDRVAGWYRDPARANRFSIATVDREGPATILTGSMRGGDAIRVRLTPGAEGGTDGLVIVTAAN